MTGFERLVLLLGCKASLILGIVAALAMLVGRRWPQSCTTWLRFGVVALLALPVGVWALPMIGIPVLSAPRPVIVAGMAPGPREQANPLAGEMAGSQDSSDNQPGGSPAAGSTKRGQQCWSAIKILGPCLAVAYGLVTAVLTVRFVAAFRGLEDFRSASSPVHDSDWQAALAHWSRVLQLRRPVDLRSSDNVAVPMTFGWKAPVILVPVECIAPCDRTEREAIIIHELKHIAQGDFFWHVLTQLAGVLYWIHPLVWLIRRQDGMLRERICDAFCSQHLSRESYAQALVRIAGRSTIRLTAALGIAMARPSSLRRRLSDLQAGMQCGIRHPVAGDRRRSVEPPVSRSG